MESNNVTCKYCGSITSVVRFGHPKGVQHYFCKICKRAFINRDSLLFMKTPTPQVTCAMSMYYGGSSLDAIQRHIEQQYQNRLSEPTIYYWVIRYTKEAVKRAKSFQPAVGDIWIADETMLKVGGRNVWFWDLIDKKTRYLLASRLSTTRSTKDAEALMQQAYETAGKAPKKIITDKLASYLDGIENVFGSATKHVQSRPFVAGDSTQIIERFHGTLKDRTKVVRGFKNMDTARLLTQGFLIHYNFFKEHETLGNTPPAQKMNKPVPFADWVDVVRGSQPRNEAQFSKVERTTTVVHNFTKKKRAPRRMPELVKRKTYHETSLVQTRR